MYATWDVGTRAASPSPPWHTVSGHVTLRVSSSASLLLLLRGRMFEIPPSSLPPPPPPPALVRRLTDASAKRHGAAMEEACELLIPRVPSIITGLHTTETRVSSHESGYVNNLQNLHYDVVVDARRREAWT